LPQIPQAIHCKEHDQRKTEEEDGTHQSLEPKGTRYPLSEDTDSNDHGHEEEGEKRERQKRRYTPEQDPHRLVIRIQHPLTQASTLVQVEVRDHAATVKDL
jgi:hypothetical protein